MDRAPGRGRRGDGAGRGRRYGRSGRKSRDGGRGREGAEVVVAITMNQAQGASVCYGQLASILVMFDSRVSTTADARFAI